MSNDFHSFAYAAPLIKNHLPNTVCSSSTYLSFRKSLKIYFFNQAFPTKTVLPVLIDSSGLDCVLYN